MNTPNEELPIPNRYHFVWMGRELPYFAVLAIRSVIQKCHGAETWLWTDQKEGLAIPEDLQGVISIRYIDLEKILGDLPEEQYATMVENLSESYLFAGTAKGEHPSMPVERSRTNLARTLILYVYGGIYLDVDVLVLKDLAPLRKETGFLGYEKALWTYKNKQNSFYRFVKGPLFEVLRFIAVHTPLGYRFYQRVAPLFPDAINGAVSGFRPLNKDLELAINTIIQMPMDVKKRTLVLGPHLWQKIEEHLQETRLFDYRYFYPLGPLVAKHYFRKRNDPSRHADRILSDQTFVAHFCLSSTKGLYRYSPESIEELSKEEAYAYLAREVNKPVLHTEN